MKYFVMMIFNDNTTDINNKCKFNCLSFCTLYIMMIYLILYHSTLTSERWQHYGNPRLDICSISWHQFCSF